MGAPSEEQRLERALAPWPEAVRVYTDGGFDVKAGVGTCAFLAYDAEGNYLHSRPHVLPGAATTNQAEYWGAIRALQWARAITPRPRSLVLLTDSQVLQRHLLGLHEVRNADLVELMEIIRFEIAHFAMWDAIWIPRRLNRRADRLCSQAVRSHQLGVDPERLPLDPQLARRVLEELEAMRQRRDLSCRPSRRDALATALAWEGAGLSEGTYGALSRLWGPHEREEDRPRVMAGLRSLCARIRARVSNEEEYDRTLAGASAGVAP